MILRIRDGRAASAKSGFTLFEILIVLAIMGLLLGLFILRGSGGSKILALRATADELAFALRSARIQAVSTSKIASVMVDVAAHRWRTAAGTVKPLPPGIAISVVTTAPQIKNAATAAIAFEPDGSASGGKISIGEDKRRIDIDVGWLTGAVAVSDVP